MLLSIILVDKSNILQIYAMITANYIGPNKSYIQL